MSSTRFDNLAIDHLRPIFHLLPSYDIARVWLTGNRTIQRSMAAGAVLTFHHKVASAISPQHAWPSVLSQLNSVTYLSLEYLQVLNFQLPLRKAPASITSISAIGVDFSPYLSDSSSHFDPDEPYSLDDIFPELKSLHLVLNERTMTVSRLPATLTSLKLPVGGVITSGTLDQLWSLTELRAANWQPVAAAKFARGLRSLSLDEYPFYHVLRVLPLLKELNNFRLNIPGPLDIDPSLLETILTNLPTTLKTLELGLLQAPFPTKFLECLPRSLESLSLRWRATIDAQLFDILPRTLRKLHLGSPLLITFPEDEESMEKCLSQLPPYLTSLRILDQDVYRMGGIRINSKEPLLALPPSLTHLGNVELASSDLLPFVPRSLTRLNLSAKFIQDISDISTLSLLPPTLTHLPEIGAHYNSRVDPALLLRFPELWMITKMHLEAFKIASTSHSPSSSQPSSIGRVSEDNAAEIAASLSSTPSSSSARERQTVQIPVRFAVLSLFTDPNMAYEVIFGEPKYSERSGEGECVQTPDSLDTVRTRAQNAEARQPLRDLQITSHHGNYQDVCPSMIFSSPLPASLHSLVLTEISVETHIFAALQPCRQLNLLHIWSIQSAITDDMIEMLPRSLTSLTLAGAQTLISTKGLSALPPFLRKASIPGTPVADAEHQAMTPYERERVLPKSLTNFMIINYVVLGHKAISPWIISLKKTLA